MQVFIQNEAGSNVKHRHNEKTQELLGRERVSRPYPFPYGFVVGTTAGDGLNVDCFVITDRPLKTGALIECEPIGLMEQIDAGDEDHNVIARPPGEDAEVTDEIKDILLDFVGHVFDHVPDKQVEIGQFLDAAAAHAFLQARSDTDGDQSPSSLS